MAEDQVVSHDNVAAGEVNVDICQNHGPSRKSGDGRCRAPLATLKWDRSIRSMGAAPVIDGIMLTHEGNSTIRS